MVIAAVTRDMTLALAAALAAVSILVGLAGWWKTLRETTLVSSWGWSIAAVVAIAGAEIVPRLTQVSENDIRLSPLRLCAAALTLCPVISVLGSKRPQHGIWNFVVVSLWGVVVLPALTALVMQRGERFVLGDIRGWMLWVLIGMGLANYLPTRFWPSALLAAFAQMAIFASHLPLIRSILFISQTGNSGILGLGLLALALAAASLVSTMNKSPASAIDMLWLEFRDLYGLLWSLRVQERMNAAANTNRWECALTWGGVRAKGDSEPDTGQSAAQGDDSAAVRQTLKGLLRRFVSSEWIAARMKEGVD